MTKKELLINEIERAPEPILDEMLEYVHFLKEKMAHHQVETAIASESSLGKDWLKPEEEEEEAWQNL